MSLRNRYRFRGPARRITSGTVLLLLVLQNLLIVSTTTGAGAEPSALVDVPSSSYYTQNFDSLGATATAAIPLDFKVDNPTTVRSVGTYDAAAAATTLLGGANLSTTAQNGIYNFGSGTNT